jgi:orotidine 5'-phosphate decarboxylase subfamily 2
MNFSQKLQSAINKNNSLLCIGLDTDLEKIPKHILSEKDPIFTFNKAIIDSTGDLVCSYKPNIAFYEAFGIVGLVQLKKTIEYLKRSYPNIPVILDAKRGDIANTAKMYAKAVFEYWAADATTVNPYLGFDAIEPFLKYKDKGIVILCRTSNPSASDFQESEVPIHFHLGGDSDTTPRENFYPLYIKVAKKVVEWNRKHKNCMLVVGATGVEELKKIREVAKEIFFLVPGIESQGGNLEHTLKFGLTKEKSGLIINVSRGIIYTSAEKDFANNARNQAKTIRDSINKYRYE